MWGFNSIVGRTFVFAGIFFPGFSHAQNYYITPSLSIAEVYDDNIFFTAAQEESDYITRLSPEIDMGYETERLRLLGFYTFDSEIYADNSGLNDAIIRQSAIAALQYEMSQSLTFNLNSAYDETQTPNQLNLLTGITPGRVNAERFTIGPSLDYELNPLTNLALGYNYINDRLAGGVESDTHSFESGIEREITRNDSVSFTYTYNRYLFESGGNITSHVPLLGWAHQFSPRTSIAIAAGPRVTEGSVDPEIALVVLHRLEHGQISVTYDRTLTTLIGQSGTVETDRVGADMTYLFTPKLELQMIPSYTNGDQLGLDFDVYQFDLGLTYRINDFVSLTGLYQYSLQEGSFGNLVFGDIERNVILLSIRLSAPTFGNRSLARQTR